MIILRTFNSIVFVFHFLQSKFIAFCAALFIMSCLKPSIYPSVSWFILCVNITFK